jgi:hypothetical protein
MYYKISRLILTPTAGKPSTTGDIFISNPQIDQESILGKLFFLSEIESTKPAALKIINFFISALPACYYQSEKITLKEKMGTIRISEIFESALSRVNAEFEIFLKKEKIKIEPKALNLMAGVIYKNDLVFSSAGKIKTLLIYPEQGAGAENTDKKTYKISGVEDRGDEEKKAQLTKIFSNITEGKIMPEGYFVFSNEIFPEYVNNRHLAKIITTLPPVSAVENLKNQLHKINNYVTFLALIIKSSATPPVKRSIPQMQLNVTASDSLERMNETENDTEKYLSPVGIIRANGFFLWGKKIMEKIGGAPEKKLTAIIRDKVFLVKKHRLTFLTKFGYHAKNFFSYAFNFIIYFLKLLAHPAELTKKIIRGGFDFWQAVKFNLAAAWRWLFNLTAISKILLVVFLICVSFFGASVYRLTKNKQEQTTQQNYQETIQLLTQKQNQIEASLLYRNEEKARELITETGVLLDKLRQLKNMDQNTIANFTAVNAEQLEKISHVINVGNPQELADFKKLNSNAEIKTIVNAGERIIAADINNQSLYEFNLTAKTASVLKTNITNINYGALWQDDQALFLSAKGGIIIDDKNAATEINNAFAPAENEIVSIASYNSRLYLLSASQNNILRFVRDFSSSESWIKENLDVKNAVSLDIDGYVYVLKNNGEIIRLLSGYANEFKMSAISPAFSNPTKIKLTGDSEKGLIYILEPAQNRLVVFDKTGKFLQQYKLPTLANLKDFAVLEKDKKILLLNDAAIYEITMEEIK